MHFPFTTFLSPRGPTVAALAQLVVVLFCCFPATRANATDVAAPVLKAPVATSAALQEIGGRSKALADQLQRGGSVSSLSIASLEQSLRQIATTTPADDAKVRAISRLLGNARLRAAQVGPSAAALHMSADDHVARAPIDTEVLTPNHGSSCLSALGIAVNLPVQLTLSQDSSGVAQAWFRYEPATSGHIVFRTNSSGPDPALAVFRSCSTDANAITTNDDAVGLDALVTMVTHAHEPLYVRLSNSGAAGSILASVQDANATISGTVTDAVTGTPLTNGGVGLFGPDGEYLGLIVATNGNGAYTISAPAGSYYVVAGANGVSGVDAYVRDVYPAALCNPSWFFNTDGCPLASGQLQTVVSGENRGGINFALTHGQQIAGEVRDLNNNTLNATMSLFDDAGALVTTTNTLDNGRYSIAPLKPGNYKIQAQADGYGSQMFDHLACTDAAHGTCDLSRASLVSISNHDVIGIDFDLAVRATIRGFVTAPGSSGQISGNVTILDQTGAIVGSAQTSYSSGEYVSTPLAPGTYYAYASYSGYFSQLFNGIDCVTGCSTLLANATPLIVSQFSQQLTANFTLTPYPTLHGHVSEAATGLPVANAIVSLLFDFQLGPVEPQRPSHADANGDYSISRIPPGTYMVIAQSNDHVDQLYPAVPCEKLPIFFNDTSNSCNLRAAQRITISKTAAPAVNFSLPRSASITGHVTVRAGAGSDLPGILQVQIFSDSSSRVAGTDSFGNYVITDVFPGTYHALALSGDAFVPQYWPQVDCTDPSCTPPQGNAIVLASGAALTGIDFLVTERDAIVGRVLGPLGQPVAGAIIDSFDAANSSYFASAITDAQGYYAVHIGFGDRYAATDAGPHFVDQIFSGVSCPNGPAYFGACSFAAATALSANASVTQPILANFTLQFSDPIFHGGFE